MQPHHLKTKVMAYSVNLIKNCNKSNLISSMKQKMCEAFLIIKVPLILYFGNVLGKLYYILLLI